MRKYLLISMALLLAVTTVLGLSGIKKNSQEEVTLFKAKPASDRTLQKKKGWSDAILKSIKPTEALNRH